MTRYKKLKTQVLYFIIFKYILIFSLICFVARWLNGGKFLISAVVFLLVLPLNQNVLSQVARPINNKYFPARNLSLLKSNFRPPQTYFRLRFCRSSNSELSLSAVVINALATWTTRLSRRSQQLSDHSGISDLVSFRNLPILMVFSGRSDPTAYIRSRDINHAAYAAAFTFFVMCFAAPRRPSMKAAAY